MVSSVGNRQIVVTVTSNIASFTAGMNSVRSQLTGLQASVSGTLGALSTGIGNIANQMILTGAAGTGFSQYFIRMFGDALPAVEEYYKSQAKLLSLLKDARTDYEGMSNDVWKYARAQSEASIYTATEITNSWYVIAQAGYETFEEIKQISEATTKLATAQAADITQTTEDVITVLKAYNISAGDAWKVTNLLAAGATASKVSMDDYHDGLKYIVTAFASLGVSIEDAITSFTHLTDVGYTGQNAGRILRDAMNDLLNPTAEAMDVLRKYNVQLYNNQSQYDSLASTYESIGSVVDGLKGKQEELNGVMQASRDITEELNMAEQQLSIDAAKVRLKYNEENPIIKSLEAEKDALVEAKDAAKEYYNELKEAKKERQADIYDQKSVITDLRRRITEINQTMSFNRAQGYHNDTPVQLGLVEERKQLQDELAKEQKSLDGLKDAQQSQNEKIDDQKKKVTAASEAITEQNKKIKTEKEKAADAEQKELNAIEKKKIAIDEEKLAQQKKYNLLEDEQRKVNKQLDEYNSKLKEAKDNMDKFVPDGIRKWEDVLKSLYSSGLSLSESEMGVVFGKQSGAAMSYEAKMAAEGKYGERKADLIAKEGTGQGDGEADIQNKLILESMYGQGKIAATKLENTTFAAIQPYQQDLIDVFKSITDEEMIANLTTIKTEMLGGIIDGVNDILPLGKELVDRVAELNPAILGSTGAFLALSTVIMAVVSPAILTIGVFLSLMKMVIDPLKSMVDAGGIGAACGCGGVGGASGKGGKKAAATATAASVVDKPSLEAMERGTKYTKGMERLGPNAIGNLETQALISANKYGNAGVYDTVTGTQLIHEPFGPQEISPAVTAARRRQQRFDALNKVKLYPADFGVSKISKPGEDEAFARQIDAIMASMGGRRASPIPKQFGDRVEKDFVKFGSVGRSQLDIEKDLELLEKKMGGTAKMGGTKFELSPFQVFTKNKADEIAKSSKLVATGIDDIAIVGAKAAPVAKNVGTEVGLLGSIAARIAPLLGMGGAASTAGVAGGIASVSGAGVASTGILATIGTTLASLALPITIIIAALGLLYLAWTNNFMGIQDRMNDFANWVGKNFSWIIEWFDKVTREIGESFESWLGGFGKVWDGIMNMDLSELAEGLGQIAGSFLRMQAQVLYYAGEFIGDFFYSLIEGVTTGGPDFLSALAAFLSDIPNMLVSFGQVVLFSASEFGFSFLNALMGVEETDAQREDRRKKVAAMMDQAYKDFGITSNLSGYVDVTNKKRAERETKRDAEEKMDLLKKYTNTGIPGADKANADLIDSTKKATGANKDFTKSSLEMINTVEAGVKAGKSNADILKELGFTNVDTSKSLNGLTVDLSKTNTGLTTVGSSSESTKDALERLKTESDKKLAAPNYDQAKFNAFNNQINTTIGNLQRMQQTAANAGVANATVSTPVTAIEAAKTMMEIPKTVKGIISGTTPAKPIQAVPTAEQGKKQSENFISGIVTGLTSALPLSGPIGMVTGGIAGVIAGFFPHSPAKTGPLTELPKMGAEVAKQLADGMNSNVEMVGKASTQIAQTIVDGIMAPDGVIMKLQAPLDVVAGTPMSYKDPAFATPRQRLYSHNEQIAQSQGASGVHNQNFNFTFNGAQNKQDLKKFGKDLVKDIERGRGNFKAMG